MQLPPSLRFFVSAFGLAVTVFALGCGGSDSDTTPAPSTGKKTKHAGSGGGGGGDGSGGNGAGGSTGNGSGGSAFVVTAEVCNNGLDDDENGLVDDGCACTADSNAPCFAGDPGKAGKGQCLFGSHSCGSFTAGEFTQTSWTACLGSGAPSDEICGDGIDNNCDGTVDDGCPCTTGESYPCNTACGAGESKCVDGKISQCTAPAPAQEICNGKDDNCDGQVDEDLTQSCGSTCGKGTQTCMNGKWSDCSAPAPATEICNGKDDNCDGDVDEGCSCTNGKTQDCQNLCGKGTQTCTGGKWGACSAPKPAPETCDGVDNDCNGVIDDGIVSDCSTACGPGVAACIGGQLGACTAKNPTAEICGNGKDDNCDGKVDENCGTCSLLCAGACCQGATSCCPDGKCPDASGKCTTSGSCTTVFCGSHCCASGTECCSDGSCPGADGSCPTPACKTVTCGNHCCATGTACCPNGACPAANGSCDGTQPSCNTVACGGNCCPNGDACCPGGSCPPSSGKCETPCLGITCKSECCFGLGTMCCKDGSCPDAFGDCPSDMMDCATVQCDWECCASGTACCDDGSCPGADGKCGMGGTGTMSGCSNQICDGICCPIKGDCCSDGSCPSVDGKCDPGCKFVTCDGTCCPGGSKCCSDGSCPFSDGSCSSDDGSGGQTGSGGSGQGGSGQGGSGQGGSGQGGSGQGGSGQGGDTGSGGMTSVMGNCNGGFVKTMLVLDRSMSMALTPSGKRLPTSSTDYSTARWAIAANAVNHMLDSTPAEESVAWGLTLFPEFVQPQANKLIGCERLPDAVKNGLWKSNDPAVCSSDATQVPPAADSVAAIKAAVTVDQTYLCDTTATLQALTNAAAYTDLAYVVLVTDGQYECDADPLPMVQKLFDQGTKTFVVGFDAADANLLGEKGKKSLNDMACAGGVPQNAGSCSMPDAGGHMTYTGSGTAFYYASDSAGSQLEMLLDQVAQKLKCPFGCHDLCQVTKGAGGSGGATGDADPVSRGCDNNDNCAKKVCDEGGTYTDDSGMTQTETPQPYCCDTHWDIECRLIAEHICDLECSNGAGGAGN